VNGGRIGGRKWREARGGVAAFSFFLAAPVLLSLLVSCSGLPKGGAVPHERRFASKTDRDSRAQCTETLAYNLSLLIAH
jgi:hypothetical protein